MAWWCNATAIPTLGRALSRSLPVHTRARYYDVHTVLYICWCTGGVTENMLERCMHGADRVVFGWVGRSYANLHNEAAGSVTARPHTHITSQGTATIKNNVR